MMDDDPIFERHGDDLGGFRYDEEFDLNQLGHAGGDVMNVSNDDDHMESLNTTRTSGWNTTGSKGSPARTSGSYLTSNDRLSQFFIKNSIRVLVTRLYLAT